MQRRQVAMGSKLWVPRAVGGLLPVALCLLPVEAAADPLQLETGKPVEITCETQSVVVAGEARVSKGTMRLRLAAAEQTGGAQAGTWSVIAVDDGHAASFAHLHRQACAAGCPIQTGPRSQPMLWAPRMALPEAMDGDAALTVAAIDPEKLTLKASTFRAKDLAALEQGECRREN
jgi:hypothetical protein